MEKFGENIFRDLEGEYINQIVIENKDKEEILYLDLGGKASIHPKIKDLLRSHGINYFIQIYASNDRYIENLKTDYDTNKTRPNYQLYIDKNRQSNPNKIDTDLLNDFHNELRNDRMKRYDSRSDAIILTIKIEKPEDILKRTMNMVKTLREKASQKAKYGIHHANISQCS